MRSPRHQLILLGMICQALSWDDWIMPLAVLALWVGCHWVQGRWALPAWMDLSLLGVGAGVAFVTSLALGESPHFFIGHGLTLLQAARLIRPLNRREQWITVLVAFVQIGVACTVVYDFRFIPILAGIFFLVPRTLAEMARQRFGVASAPPPRVALHAYAGMAVVSVLIFLALPRGLLGSSFGARGFRGREGSLEDSLLDSSRGGRAGSGRVVFQVKTDKIDYFRCFVFSDYDGVRWYNSERDMLRGIAGPRRGRESELRRRQVRVRDVRSLGRVLPADGRIVRLEGRFFRRAWMNDAGIVECEAFWNTGENLYEYAIDPQPEPEPIPDRLRERTLDVPPGSERLKTWLAGVVAGETDPLRLAQRIEHHLQTHLSYSLGAPKLSRINTLEDFLFNQKSGHCERFASAMAALLRHQGIPSRVVIGYLPSRPNWFSGWYSVRFRDAHAWTEGYIPGRGWVRFDATPRAMMPIPAWEVTDLLESLDSAWFANVINFDGLAQKEFLFAAAKVFTALLSRIFEHGHLVLGILLASMLLFWGRSSPWRKGLRRPAKRAVKPEVVLIEAARADYGEMLRLLARQGVHRSPSQTPGELLHRLRETGFHGVAQVQTITDAFIDAVYGLRPPTAEQQRAIQGALGELRRDPSPGKAAGRI